MEDTGEVKDEENIRHDKIVRTKIKAARVLLENGLSVEETIQVTGL